GTASAIAGLLGAFPMHAARRQLYVPLEVMERHGALAEDAFAGKATAALKAALADLRAHVRGHLADAKASANEMPPAIVPALLPAALVRPALDRLDRRQRKNPFAETPIPAWR